MKDTCSRHILRYVWSPYSRLMNNAARREIPLVQALTIPIPRSEWLKESWIVEKVYLEATQYSIDIKDPSSLDSYKLSEIGFRSK
jgi:hypothetical protein